MREGRTVNPGGRGLTVSQACGGRAQGELREGGGALCELKGWGDHCECSMGGFY